MKLYSPLMEFCIRNGFHAIKVSKQTVSLPFLIYWRVLLLNECTVLQITFFVKVSLSKINHRRWRQCFVRTLIVLVIEVGRSLPLKPCNCNFSTIEIILYNIISEVFLTAHGATIGLLSYIYLNVQKWCFCSSFYKWLYFWPIWKIGNFRKKKYALAMVCTGLMW